MRWIGIVVVLFVVASAPAYADDKPKLPKRKPRGKDVSEPLFKNIVEDRY